MTKFVTTIAIIRWEDPATYVEWMSLKKCMKKKPGSVLSVGVLISEDKDFVRIALDFMDGKEYHGVGVIPRRAIIKMKKISIPPGM